MEKSDQCPTSNRVIWLLLSYLHSHPDAKDTAEGIRSWWLHGRRATVARLNVREALNRLVAKDWLTRRESMSGQQIYGLNQARRMELEQLFNPVSKGIGVLEYENKAAVESSKQPHIKPAGSKELKDAPGN